MNFNLRGMFFLTHEIDRRMAATMSEYYRSLIFITSISATLGIDRAVGILRFKGCRRDDGKDLCGALPALGYPRFRSSPEDYRNINDKGCTGQITVRIQSGLVPAGRWGEPLDIGKVVVLIATGQM